VDVDGELHPGLARPFGVADEKELAGLPQLHSDCVAGAQHLSVVRRHAVVEALLVHQHHVLPRVVGPEHCEVRASQAS